jgi:type IV secretory pathway VirB10-like protein
MTDTSSSTTKKTNAQSDFASPLNTQPSENVSQKPNENSPPPPSKTPQDKCEEVLHELNNLEKEVEQFSGRKNEKSFLKIDEYLTRCLLKLDEIERTDDKLNQIRKRLINYTQLLSDKLEAKALMNENNEKKAESNNQANKQKCESSSNETMELKKDDNNNDTKVTEQ